MDAIDTEIDALQKQWADEKAAEDVARQERRSARRLEVREKFRRGELPAHFKECRDCARAILSLDPSTACRQGRLCEQFIIPDGTVVRVS